MKTHYLFPNIYRFITEKLKTKGFFYSKIALFSLITTSLLVVILLRGYALLQELQILQAAKDRRDDLVKEQVYWQGVVTRHPGYRDAEFRLAVVSYELGQEEKAKSHLDQVLEIDPLYKDAREFAKQVGL